MGKQLDRITSCENRRNEKHFCAQIQFLFLLPFSTKNQTRYASLSFKNEGPITELEQTGEIVATFAMLIAKWFNDGLHSLMDEIIHGSDAKAKVSRADELLGFLNGACGVYWLKVTRQFRMKISIFLH